MNPTAHRRLWAIDKNLTDRAEAELVCAAVLEALEPALHLASLDVITDFPDLMPEHVRDAEHVLLRLALADHPDSQRLDLPAAAAQWPAFKTYAPWSIDVDLHGQDGLLLGGFHDCGYSVTALLTDEEAAWLQERVQSVAAVRLLEQIHTRRRHERRARRKAWFRRWLPSR